MGQRRATCRVCGCELDGRDVYEGICRDCLEAEILGSGPRPRPPKRPKAAPRPKPEPPPGPVIEGVPPPDEASVDMDADTKELVVIGDEEAQAPPQGDAQEIREATIVDRGEPAGTSVQLGAEPIEALSYHDTNAARAPAEPDEARLDTDTEAVTLTIADDDAELEVADVPDETDEPPGVAVAVELDEDDQDPGYVLPMTEVTTGVPSAAESQDAAVTTPPQALRLLEDDEAPAPQAPPEPARSATARTVVSSTAEPPPPDLARPFRKPAPQAPPPRRAEPKANDEPPSPRLVYDAQLDSRFDYLESRLERLTARLDALAEAQAEGSARSPERVLVGILAVLGALALLVGGVLAIANLLG